MLRKINSIKKFKWELLKKLCDDGESFKFGLKCLQYCNVVANFLEIEGQKNNGKSSKHCGIIFPFLSFLLKSENASKCIINRQQK